MAKIDKTEAYRHDHNGPATVVAAADRLVDSRGGINWPVIGPHSFVLALAEQTFLAKLIREGASSGPARQRRLRRNWIVLDPIDGLATDTSAVYSQGCADIASGPKSANSGYGIAGASMPAPPHRKR